MGLGWDGMRTPPFSGFTGIGMRWSHEHPPSTHLDVQVWERCLTAFIHVRKVNEDRVYLAKSGMGWAGLGWIGIEFDELRDGRGGEGRGGEGESMGRHVSDHSK